MFKVLVIETNIMAYGSADYNKGKKMIVNVTINITVDSETKEVVFIECKPGNGPVKFNIPGPGEKLVNNATIDQVTTYKITDYAIIVEIMKLLGYAPIEPGSKVFKFSSQNILHG